jgi:hypothetical protein
LIKDSEYYIILLYSKYYLKYYVRGVYDDSGILRWQRFRKDKSIN